jgi:hypothetical protein
MAKKQIGNTKGKVVGKVLLVLLLVILVIIIIAQISSNLQWNSVKNDYQQEVNGLVTSDFTLVSSKLDAGIDVGTTLTDDYTTHLHANQAVAIIDSNALKKGYTPSDIYEMSGSCQGGPLTYISHSGYLGFCLKKISTGELTIEFELNNFRKIPIKSESSGTCLGDCRNQ